MLPGERLISLGTKMARCGGEKAESPASLTILSDKGNTSEAARIAQAKFAQVAQAKFAQVAASGAAQIAQASCSNCSSGVFSNCSKRNNLFKQLRQVFLEGWTDYAFFGNDRRHIFVRRYVEGRVEHFNAFGGGAFAE